MRVTVDGADIAYREVGSGPPIVFVHGVYVAGALWDDVASRLPGNRCIAPTWPLGAHGPVDARADLSARAAARRIPAFLDALDLHDVTLVGNDTGGGLCLASLGSGLPGLDRIARLVLTNCDSYEHFPPKGFDGLVKLCRVAAPVGRVVLRFLASGPGQRLFLKSVCKRPPTGERVREIFGEFATSSVARRDALRVTQSLEPSVTLEAVDALRAFSKPVLLPWGDADKLFPVEHAERLQADFPNARLQVITRASTYVMLDDPTTLAASIERFINETS